jgi:amidase
MARDPGKSGLDRRQFVGAVAGVAVAPALAGVTGAAPLAAAATSAPDGSLDRPFELAEATIADLARGMAEGRWSSRQITSAYLERIAGLDRATTNAVAETNPEALEIAARLDAERQAGKLRGPLHGIPVLVKDNLDSGDRMKTSAGSLALADSVAARDSTVVARLREAGAVLLGKTNLSEWANFRSTRSSSGWSGRGGQVNNPYALDRNPCGSSSGTGAAISANLAAAGIGSETDGSVVCPSSMCGLVGIKPTVGRVSRAGIIPISASQDTAGPMARTVTDAAHLLAAIVGEDARDPATAGSAVHATDFLAGLRAEALRGARLGVVKGFAGYHPEVDRQLGDLKKLLQSLGAVLVEDLELPHDYDDAEYDVLLYEFKSGLESYLAGLPATVVHRKLADLIAFNDREAAREMPYFGQEIFLAAEKKGPLTDKAYLDARAKCVLRSRAEGIDALLAKHQLQALVGATMGPAYPTDWINGDHYTGSSSSPAAVAGYPHVTVPAGYVFGLPWGFSFVGAAWSEARLLAYAYAFEQGTRQRRAPRLLARAELPAS